MPLLSSKLYGIPICQPHFSIWMPTNVLLPKWNAELMSTTSQVLSTPQNCITIQLILMLKHGPHCWSLPSISSNINKPINPVNFTSKIHAIIVFLLLSSKSSLFYSLAYITGIAARLVSLLPCSTPASSVCSLQGIFVCLFVFLNGDAIISL